MNVAKKRCNGNRLHIISKNRLFFSWEVRFGRFKRNECEKKKCFYQLDWAGNYFFPMSNLRKVFPFLNFLISFRKYYLQPRLLAFECRRFIVHQKHSSFMHNFLNSWKGVWNHRPSSVITYNASSTFTIILYN